MWALLVNNLSLYFCFLYVDPFSTRNASLRSRLIATCHRLLPLSLLRCSLVSGEQPSLLSLLSSQFHRSKKTRMTSDSDCKSTSVSVTLISYNFHSKDLKIHFFFFPTNHVFSCSDWILYWILFPSMCLFACPHVFSCFSGLCFTFVKFLYL